MKIHMAELLVSGLTLSEVETAVTKEKKNK
jgi:hypothetical protein